MVKPIPEGTRTITPHLVVRGGEEAIDFYKRAFGAVERAKMAAPGGLIGHAELQIGDSLLYLADEFTAVPGPRAPRTLRGSSAVIHLYVPDVDAAFERATGAGAKVHMPVGDQFWGDRYGQVEDPFGHFWAIATHTEDLTPEEMMRRAQQAMAAMLPPAAPRKRAPSVQRKHARSRPAAKRPKPAARRPKRGKRAPTR